MAKASVHSNNNANKRPQAHLSDASIAQALIARGVNKIVANGVAATMTSAELAGTNEEVIELAIEKATHVLSEQLGANECRINSRGNPVWVVECANLADLAGAPSDIRLKQNDPMRIALNAIATHARTMRMLNDASGRINEHDRDEAIRAAAHNLTAVQLILEDILEVSGEGYEPVSASSTPANDVTTSARGGAQQ